MIKNFSIVRNCKNCVKPRRSRPVGRFVCSNYVSSNADRVKGHHAKRLFAFNSKRVNREFDIKNGVGSSNTDEALIAQALKCQQEFDQAPTELSVIEKAVEQPLGEYEFSQRCDAVNRQRQRLLDKAQHAAQEASNRQKRRIAFLKDHNNKICHICGSRGHVAKECASIKRKQAVAKRATEYKKHLIKKNKFQLDLDAEYKRLHDRIKALETELSALKTQDNGVNPVHIASKELSDTIKVSHISASQQSESRSPAVKTGDDLESECSSSHVDQANQHELTYEEYLQRNYEATKEYFRTHKPKDDNDSQCEGAQTEVTIKCDFIRSVVPKLLSSVALLLLGITLICLINKARNVYPSVLATCVEFASTIRWNSYSICPSKSTLFVIMLVFLFIVMFVRRVLYKTNKMIEWETLSSYRNELQQRGVTQRLPYKVSQIATPDYSYTSWAEYQQCKQRYIAALTPISVLIFIARSIKFVIKNILGLCNLFYIKCVRGLLLKKVIRPLFKFMKFLSRSVFILGIIVIRMCFVALVLAIKHYRITATVCLAIFLYGHMEYQTMVTKGFKLLSIGINWVCQIQKTILAKLASCLGMMAFRIHRITCLTSIAPTFSRLLTIIYGLFTRILGVWKHN